VPPLVSAIMRINEGWNHYAPETIKAFLRQDYPNKELIIIDQNERGKEFIKNMGLTYHPEIKHHYIDVPKGVIEKETRRQTLARIAGYRKIGGMKAKGKYLISWDDDDINFPDRITESVNSIECGFDCCGITELLMEYLDQYYLLNMGNYFYRPEYTFIYNKEVFDNLHNRPSWEDMQQVTKGLNFGSITNGLIFVFRIHEGNASTKENLIKILKGVGPIKGKLKNIVMNKLENYYG